MFRPKGVNACVRSINRLTRRFSDHSYTHPTRLFDLYQQEHSTLLQHITTACWNRIRQVNEGDIEMASQVGCAFLWPAADIPLIHTSLTLDPPC